MIALWNSPVRSGKPYATSPSVRALAPALLSLAVACAPAEEDPPAPVVSAIAPVSPTGSVSGFVYDALTGAPLEGTSVVARVPAADAAKQASTDADGAFVIEGVPASNQVALQYRDEAHFDAWDTVNIPSSAGNLAQDNGVGFSGPIGLLPKPAADAVTPDVLVRVAGVPAAATVSAHLEVAWFDDGEPRGSLFATVTDDGSGRFSLAGLPDFLRLAAVAPDARMRVVVVPQDAAYAPRVTELSVRDALTQGTVIVDLVTPDELVEDDIVIVSSNVRDLMDSEARFPTVLPTGTAVTVEFSDAVEAESFFATAVNNRGQALATAATVDGADVTLDITGVGDGDEVYLYLEALPAGASAATGSVPLVQASGFFVTPASQGLGIAAFDAARQNNALRGADFTTLLCPADSGAELWLELTEHVGARDEDGEPLATNALLPIRVTSTTAPADHPLNPANGGLAGRVVERATGVPASGFTRWVRIPWLPIATDLPAGSTATYQFKLVFNDASLGVTGEDAVVRSPSGAPVETLQQAGVELAVTATGCVPPP